MSVNVCVSDVTCLLLVLVLCLVYVCSLFGMCCVFFCMWFVYFDCSVMFSVLCFMLPIAFCVVS